MKITHSLVISRFLPGVFAILAVLLALCVQATAADYPDDTKVYWDGGKRGHVEGCRRLPKDPAELAKMPVKTYGEMIAGGALLCSRCPGSTTAGKGNSGGGSKKGKAEESDVPAVEYDPNTKVYADALWLRVHAETCPNLILKEKRKAMTLEEADKAGYRLGEEGQSGRTNCCLVGYKRKHPAKTISDDTILAGNDLQKNVKHLPGCHRYFPSRIDMRRTKKEWEANGFTVCPHCIERGPSVTTVSDEEWEKLGPTENFVPPAGWEPKPYPTDTLPPKEEVDILVEEMLSKKNGILELQFTDPLASVENFMIMRFFFGGYNLQKAYRSTGDKRLLDKMLVTAWHYHKLSTDYPSAAQQKASDPEGMAFMYDMAGWSRITLQLARKYPDQVSQKEIDEAEAFLKTIISVLKPICEGSDNLDPEMGIPQKLADDFRSRAWNRAMNGIGTLGMATAALEDLQKLKNTREYQPTIDRYRKVVGEYIKHWKSVGTLFTEEDGKTYFYYPYGATDTGKLVNGFKLYSGPEDQGHFTHLLQGVYLLYDAMPGAGVDDEFMTAIANAVHHNSYTGKHGSIQCPSADKVRPKSRKPYGAARERFYMLEAFRDGIIDGQCSTLNAAKRNAVNSKYGHRVDTLHVHYLKALRKDRSLIHLNEKK